MKISIGLSLTAPRRNPANPNLFTAPTNAAGDAGTRSLGTVTADTVADPFGGTTADTLAIAAGGYYYWREPAGAIAPNGTSKTGSIYLRADAPVSVPLRIVTALGSGAVQRVIDLTTSWQRFEATNTSNGTHAMEIGLDTRALAGGSGAAVTVYVAFRKMENAAAATAYIA